MVKRVIKLIFLLIMILLIIPLASAEAFGYDNSKLPKLISIKNDLNDLDDTNVPSPSNEEVLTFNTATSKWIAQSISSINGSDNTSWNQVLANSLYVNLIGDTMTGNLTTTKWFNGLFNWTTLSNWLSFDGSVLSFNDTKLSDVVINNTAGWTVNFSRLQADEYTTDSGAFKFHFYDDGSEFFWNLTSVGDAVNIETDNSKLVLFNSPTSGNNFKVFQIFSKEASDVTEFVVTKATDEFTSYFVRSLALVGNSTTTPTPHNCTTFANFIDCKTDVTGADFYVQDDVEIGGMLFVGEGINATDWTNISGLIDSQIADTLTIDSSSSVVWSALNTYPSTCTASQYISSLGDTLGCASISILSSQISDFSSSIEGLFNSSSWKRSGTDVTLANSGDKVGIGTSSPTHKLNVVGDLNVTEDIFSNGHQVISYQRTINIKNVTMTAVI